MADSTWTRACSIEEIADGGLLRATIKGADVLLVRRGSRVFACGNTCPHYEGPLSDGTLRAETVVCPFHNATFRFDSGELVTPPALDDLPVFEVKIEGRDVFVGKKRPPEITMPAGDDARHVVIVGAGAASAAAAEGLRRLGFAGRVSLLTHEPDLPYDRPVLSKGFVSGSAKDEWLPLRSEEFYSRLKIDVRLSAQVVGLEPRSRTVHLADGSDLTGDAVLIATGSVPRRVAIDGSDLAGVFTLRTADDARRIRAFAPGMRKVVIVGAGFIGMELASDLSSTGAEVHVAAPESEPMSFQFGPEVGRRIRVLHEEHGVEFHMGSEVRRLVGNVRVESVEISGSDSAVRAIECDLVILALGSEPAVGILHGTGLDDGGAVPVDATLMTTAPGVYAAGDIARVPYPGGLGAHRIEHWVVAQTQGRHAAAAILGAKEPYDDIPFFWTRQHETSFKYLGFPGTADRIAYLGDVASGSFLAGYFSGDRLRGVATLGMSRKMLALEPVIRGEEDLSFEEFSRLD